MMEIRSGLPIIGFADQKELVDWLTGQPADATGVWIKFAKKGGGKSSLSKAEAIDAALCHGWIDGQLNKYDDTHWLVRFTPRKPRSKWSEVNRTRALQLIEGGQMRKTGLAQVNAARADGRWNAAYAPASTAEVPGSAPPPVLDGAAGCIPGGVAIEYSSGWTDKAVAARRWLRLSRSNVRRGCNRLSRRGSTAWRRTVA
jgi:hypothetical protein